MPTEQRVARTIKQERTDEAFEVAAPAQNPRIGPRLIPVIVTVLIGIGLVLVLLLNWGGGS
jgi:hypothetical protein